MEVLIPSSSGQSFNLGRGPARPYLRRLNPFFIRSIVQSERVVELAVPKEVLIPSSSGQSFNHALRDVGVVPLVLIPSSSGQSFNHIGGREAKIRIRLNPFFIRSIVQSLEW